MCAAIPAALCYGDFRAIVLDWKPAARVSESRIRSTQSGAKVAAMHRTGGADRPSPSLPGFRKRNSVRGGQDFGSLSDKIRKSVEKKNRVNLPDDQVESTNKALPCGYRPIFERAAPWTRVLSIFLFFIDFLKGTK
jgi:hypothetical protein